MNDTSTMFYEPMRPVATALARTNQVMIGQFEKWVMLGLDSMKAYVDLSIAQMNVALKVTDPHSLFEFSDSQIAVWSFIGHRMMEDTRLMAEWSMECGVQANQLARENTLRLLFRE